ncbi:MAG: hypothetical protein MMC33_005394 [Icmadophila ericetorum]|nr:hypothetical protein [Icmadophila ericetorum]
MATQLPPLKDIERLSPLVIRILGGNPSKFTLQGTNTYLIGLGPQRLLIDTGQGLPSWKSNLSSILESESCTISTALLTHWHEDHTLGIPSLLSLCPTASIYKHTPTNSQHPISHGQVFRTKGATLRAYFCPGHTSDHMAFMLEEEGAMFTGDNVLGHGTAVFEDLGTYMSSLEGMKAEFTTENPGRAYPGHGAVIEDGKQKIGEYTAHRKMREEEVLRELETTSSNVSAAQGRDGQGRRGKTSMELVKVIYRDVPENLHIPAEGGVVQVLRKLEREGKVRRTDGNRWVLVEKATL